MHSHNPSVDLLQQRAMTAAALIYDRIQSDLNQRLIAKHAAGATADQLIEEAQLILAEHQDELATLLADANLVAWFNGAAGVLAGLPELLVATAAGGVGGVAGEPVGDAGVAQGEDRLGNALNLVEADQPAPPQPPQPPQTIKLRPRPAPEIEPATTEPVPFPASPPPSPSSPPAPPVSPPAPDEPGGSGARDGAGPTATAPGHYTWNGMHVWLPLVTHAVEDLANRKLLPRAEYDQLDAATRARAFTAAGVQTEQALEKIRGAVVDAVAKGTGEREFRQALSENLETSALGPGRQENVFRTNVADAYAKGFNRIADTQIVQATHPYVELKPIRDSRLTRLCETISRSGIGHSAIFRRDDPVYIKYRRPRHFQDRCGEVLLTIEQAAAKGVAEAVEWKKSGIAPQIKAWVDEPSLDPESRKLFESFRGRQSSTTDMSIWREEEHPRGQPENAGEFAKSNASAVTKEAAAADYKKHGTKAKAFKAWFGDWEKESVDASKVVNDEGSPQETYGTAKKVFHGTKANFKAFDKSKTGASAVGKGFYFAEDSGVAEMFADSLNDSRGKVIEAYLNIRNPFAFDGAVSPNEMAKLLPLAKKINPDAFDPSSSFGKYAEEDFARRVKEKTRGGIISGYDAWDIIRQAVDSEHVNDVLQAAGYDGIMHDAKDQAGTPAKPGEESRYGRCWIAFEPTQIKAVANAGTFDPTNPHIDMAWAAYPSDRPTKLPRWRNSETGEVRYQTKVPTSDAAAAPTSAAAAAGQKNISPVGEAGGKTAASPSSVPPTPNPKAQRQQPGQPSAPQPQRQAAGIASIQVGNHTVQTRTEQSEGRPLTPQDHQAMAAWHKQAAQALVNQGDVEQARAQATVALDHLKQAGAKAAGTTQALFADLEARADAVKFSDAPTKDKDTWSRTTWGQSLHFTTPNGTHYEIDAQPTRDSKGVVVTFNSPEGDTVTGEGSATEVLSKVVAATTALAKHDAPERIEFSASEASRQKLYDRMTKTIIKMLPGYNAYAKGSRTSGEAGNRVRNYVLVAEGKAGAWAAVHPDYGLLSF